MFSSYAVIRIRGAIVDYLRKSSNLCRTTIQMQQKSKKAEELFVGLHSDNTKFNSTNSIGIVEC